MSIEHLIKLLQSGVSHVSGSWILVMGGEDGSWQSLKSGLGYMNIDVRQAIELDQAQNLIAEAQEPPLLAYLFADEIGGLDRAIAIHATLQRYSHISKCLIVSAEVSSDMEHFSGDGENSPLILSAPKRTKLH